jgi:hypothetical protein
MHTTPTVEAPASFNAAEALCTLEPFVKVSSMISTDVPG